MASPSPFVIEMGGFWAMTIADYDDNYDVHMYSPRLLNQIVCFSAQVQF